MEVADSALIDVSAVLAGSVDCIEKALTVTFDTSDAPSDVQLAPSVLVNTKIDNTAGYVHLVADFDVGYDTVCARCLKPLHLSCHFTLDKTVCAEDSLENGDDEELVLDYAFAKDGVLDMGELVREDVILSLPSRHLCDENCKGLCPKCGHNLNEGDCSCETKEIDPRMEVFREILQQYNK